MARGDLVVFEEAMAFIQDGDFGSADVIKLAILDDTLSPIAAQAVPALGLYTEVGSGGNYAAGGDTLDTFTNMIIEVGGVVTFDDTGASVAWALDAGNDNDAYWGLIYNSTDGGARAIAFIDLGLNNFLPLRLRHR